MRVIVDTDCGTDDLLALAYLLAHKEVTIVGITTVHGLTSPRRGSSNLLRMLDRLDATHIPVFIGCEKPLFKTRGFPMEWIEDSESLAGIELPKLKGSVQSQTASEFLQNAMHQESDLTIVALGPLTNIAKAIGATRSTSTDYSCRIVAMGGAIDVPGNLGAGGLLSTRNTKAEWNIFLDPMAAQVVFSSIPNLRLVPLDATNMVPISSNLVEILSKQPQTKAASFASDILRTVATWVAEGHYYAWDPLAAVLAINPSLEFQKRVKLRIEKTGVFIGGLTRDPDGQDLEVYLSANAKTFEHEYTSTIRGTED